MLTTDGTGITSWSAAAGAGFAGLTTNGVVYATSSAAVAGTAAGTTGQVLTATTGSAPTWAANTGGWTQVTVSGSNFTMTTQALATITGLSFTPAVSTNYEIEGWIIASSSSGAGDEFGFSNAGTGATASIVWVSPLLAATASTLTTATAGTATTAVLTGSQTNAEVYFHGFIASGTGSPAFAIEGLKVTSGTLTALIGSTLRYRVLGQ
jgi:hypothetical protein